MTTDCQGDPPSVESEVAIKSAGQEPPDVPMWLKSDPLAESQIQDFEQLPNVQGEMETDVRSNPTPGELVPPQIAPSRQAPASHPGERRTATVPRFNNFNKFDVLPLDEPVHSFNTETRLMMPSVGDPFWARYGNKLRVNGTVEEYCVVDPQLGK